MTRIITVLIALLLLVPCFVYAESGWIPGSKRDDKPPAVVVIQPPADSGSLTKDFDAITEGRAESNIGYQYWWQRDRCCDGYYRGHDYRWNKYKNY